MVGLDDFSEIPDTVKALHEEELRKTALQVIHAESVASGDLPAAPIPLIDRLPGKLSLTFLYISIGAFIGFLAALVLPSLTVLSG